MNRTKKTLLITAGLAALILTAVALGRDRHPHCDRPSTQKNAVVLINTSLSRRAKRPQHWLHSKRHAIFCKPNPAISAPACTRTLIPTVLIIW